MTLHGWNRRTRQSKTSEVRDGLSGRQDDGRTWGGEASGPGAKASLHGTVQDGGGAASPAAWEGLVLMR